MQSVQRLVCSLAIVLAAACGGKSGSSSPGPAPASSDPASSSTEPAMASAEPAASSTEAAPAGVPGGDGRPPTQVITVDECKQYYNHFIDLKLADPKEKRDKAELEAQRAEIDQVCASEGIPYQHYACAIKTTTSRDFKRCKAQDVRAQ
jgi:hypothetical protein